MSDIFYRAGKEYCLGPLEGDPFVDERGSVPKNEFGDWCPFKFNPHWYEWKGSKWSKRIRPDNVVHLEVVRSVAEALKDEPETNFMEDLQSSYKRLGGVDFLVAIGQEYPLKFLDTMAKTIPMYIKQMELDQSVSVAINVLADDKGSLEGDFVEIKEDENETKV